MAGSRFDKEICPRPIGLPRPTGSADGTRDIKEPTLSSRRWADAHRASALDGSSPSLVIKEVHTPGGSGTPGPADGTRDIKEPPSSSRRRADAHRASALDGSSPSLVIKEVHTPGGSGTPGPADGTRDIKEPPSSSRRRADAHRASALDGSSPAPTLQKAQIPGRVSVLFGAADGTRTRTVSLPGDFKSPVSTDSTTAAWHGPGL